MPCEGVSWHFGSLIGMGLQAGRAGEALLPDRDAPCLISDGPLRHFGRPARLLAFLLQIFQSAEARERERGGSIAQTILPRMTWAARLQQIDFPLGQF